MYIGPMDSTLQVEKNRCHTVLTTLIHTNSQLIWLLTIFEDAEAGTKVRSDATQSDFSDSDAYEI